MDSDEAIDQLRDIFCRTKYTLRDVETVRELAAQFAYDSEVLVLAANVLHAARCNGDKTVGREEIWDAYRRAASANPMNGEAWLELGILSDIEEKFGEAEEYLRRSIELEPSDCGYATLARVLAQMGRKSESLDLIDRCEFSESTQIAEARNDILNGLWDPIEPSDDPTPRW